MKKVSEYVWIASDQELLELQEMGYKVVYQDINLSAIYEEMTDTFIGYFGLGLVLQVEGMYYWLVQL